MADNNDNNIEDKLQIDSRVCCCSGIVKEFDEDCIIIENSES